MLSLFFRSWTLRRCMKIVELSSQMKCISTYKILLFVCEESDFTKIATLIIFITHFSFRYGKKACS